MDKEGEVSSEEVKSDKKVCPWMSDTFPAGLRVLVVEDDWACLNLLEMMLKNCLYEVTTCSKASEALSLLLERKNEFDIVIIDVHISDMDGFMLLERIQTEMGLPVVMMSDVDDKDVIMKGVINGACDCMIKPVGMELLKNIWQHVVRRRKHSLAGSVGDSDRPRKPSDDEDYASSINECSWKNSRRKEEEDGVVERNDTSAMKKQRVVWTNELHNQFTAAVNQLGIDKAVPKKILELMNIPGLSRENVASHLQKYRLFLKKLDEESQHQMGQPEANLGPMLPPNGLDIQAHAVPDELPLQSFATIPAGGLGRSTANTGTIIPPVDQVNPFSSETSNLRHGMGQQQPRNNNKQVNLLHDPPTIIEPKLLAHLREPVQSFRNMGLQVAKGASGFTNLTSLRTGSTSHTDIVHGKQKYSPMFQMTQSQSGHLLSLGQQIFSNVIQGQVLGRDGTVLNGTTSAYNPISQASLFDLPKNHITELPGNGYHLGSIAGIPTCTPTGMLQYRSSLEIKGFGSISPTCNMFNEIQQNTMQDWELQNADLNFEAPQISNAIQGSLNLSPLVLGNLGVFSSQKTGHLDENTFLAEHLDEDDLMSKLLEEKEGAESNFNVDGFLSDNI